MNSRFKRCRKLWTRGVVQILAISCSVGAIAQDKPPAPKDAATELKMPNTVRAEKLKGIATLPDQVKLGFGLDLEGQKLPADWDIRGIATAVSDDKISFTTDKDETGNLVFRLPKGLSLALAQNDSISILRKTKIYGPTLDYGLLVSSSGKLVVASGRIHGESPQRAEVWNDVRLVQSGELGSTLSESQYETTYEVPVSLLSENRSIQLTIGEAHGFIVRGETCNVMVRFSHKVVPAEGQEGVFEGSGYTLEYIAVRR